MSYYLLVFTAPLYPELPGIRRQIIVINGLGPTLFYSGYIARAGIHKIINGDLVMGCNLFKILCCAGVIFGLLLAYPSSAETEGNCTMCHKYPGMGRIEESGTNDKNKTKRVFYISDNLFEKTYHGAIPCKSCHVGVTRIPHTDVDKVDCATDCHLIDPSSKKPFSHKKIVNDYKVSVHGQEGSNTPYKEDLPVCKDCHSNKAYHAEYEEQVAAMTFLKVCEECHQSGDFTKRFYEHITYRTIKRRPSKEVVRLCSTCHADLELMSKHKLDVVIGFSNTFHAKALSYGNTKVPNCLNCHAPYQLGFSPHRISSRKNNDSPTHPENKYKTCSQSGCHVDATKGFASGGYVHPSPQKIKISKLVGTKGSDPESQAQTRFQNTVISFIQMFYKILITLVIGGLALHRLLDFHATRRERNRGGHST